MNTHPKFYHHIPNLLTLMNLCSGFLSIVFVSYRNLEAAGFFIIVAAIFDFFDGFAARILRASSEKGKILDSLSDVVSFGAAPAAIVFLIIEYSLVQSKTGFDFTSASFTDRLLLFSSLIFLIASALRLASFTLQKNTRVFNGMPTPAASLFYAGLALIISDPDANMIFSWIYKLYLLIPSVILVSLLMVSRIRFISLKFNNFNFRQNVFRYLLIIFSLILLILFQKFAISPIIIIYILISVISHIIQKPSDI